MTNGEGDMKLAQETVDKFKSGPLHYAPWELLVKMFATTLATIRAEEQKAALEIVRACSTRDELHPDISITVSEFKERVIGLLEAENRKGEG